MIMTSCIFTSFAADENVAPAEGAQVEIQTEEPAEGGENAVTENTSDGVIVENADVVDTDAAVIEEEAGSDGITVQEEGNLLAEEPVKPAKPTKLKSKPGYKKATITWKASEGADYYLVKANNGKAEKKVKKTSFVVKTPDIYKSYTVKVRAVKRSGSDGLTELKSDTAKLTKVRCVRPARYLLTLKAGCTLYSHWGKKQSWTLKSGQKVMATKFAGGQYILEHNGSGFCMNRVRAANPKVEYEKKQDYSRKEATEFMNDYGLKSGTKEMVWVSTYSQHAYHFKKTSDGWECDKHWDCSTGKASTPTPTGTSFGKMTLHQKISSRHGLQWWSCFSSLNALHSKRTSWKLGVPGSGGCVRNALKNAKWIYDEVPMGSRVLIY